MGVQWDAISTAEHVGSVIPPTDNAFGRTYSAATYFPGQGARTVEFSFKGIDIYVFFILANNVPGAWTETFCRFILDGQATDYHHAPSQSADYDYNALVYSQHNLSNVDHTLLITADGYSTKSFMNFDYAIYTVDDGTSSIQPSTPTASSKSPTGAIVGGVVGGVALLFLILVLLLLRRRRRRPAEDSSIAATSGSPVLMPFTLSHPTLQLWPEDRAVPHDATPFLIPDQKKRTPRHTPNASMSSSSEALRVQRQAEISDEISGLTRDMHGSASTRGWEGSEVSRVMEQNTVMKAQIEQLQAQLHSDWALGLSNDPPPGYSNLRA
ncbi:hypothetical protein LshimejAT787_0201930 [Lyophyllum shimeji]|uniref:Uncharacterized protein n=1 Tax=Lyophyllum shimeji TaxID=47721 RepID=A0A9P3UIM9_LYOSH|nr:hypothetical protein LshimejAT787_0201930 [Lyophyllum shimeji]